MGIDDILQQEIEDTQHGRYLTFDIGDEVYGIEISHVKEIIGLQQINTMPEMPEYIKGIINLRGMIIPIIDVRLRFKKEPIPYTDRTCIIVIETDNITVGLIVDNVAEVLSIDDEDIAPPPDAISGLQNKYLKGIGKTGERVKLLIDCQKLLKEDEIEAISNV